MDEEFRFHLEEEADRYQRQGLSSEEAHRAALLAFGGVQRHKEAMRDGRGAQWVEDLFREIGFAARSLAARRVSTIVVVATLALGIGANAAVFSLVNGVLLRPLPYPEPHALVRVWTSRAEPFEPFVDVSYRDFAALRTGARSFDAIAAYSLTRRTLTDAAGEPEHITVGRVTEGFLAVLGRAPSLGRSFLPQEERDSDRIVVLGHAFWRTRYGADPQVVGRSVAIDGVRHTIVGVMPADLEHGREAALWRPLTQEEKSDDDRELVVVARLADGIARSTAARDVERVFAQLHREDPVTHRGLSAWVEPLQAAVVRNARAPLLLLQAAIALVLLIAATNVVNVVMARDLDRHRELAVRVALGAGRRRVLSRVFVEGLMLASAGSVVGLALGVVALRAMLARLPHDFPRLEMVALDHRVAAATGGVTLILAVVIGVFPAIRALRIEPAEILRGGVALSSSVARGRFRAGLVILEVALCSVLVAGVGSLALSLAGLMQVERGVRDPQTVLTVPIRRVPASEARTESLPAFLLALESELRAQRGVADVAFATHSPDVIGGFRMPVLVDGPSALGGVEGNRASLRIVTPAYFATLGTPLLAGRFPSADLMAERTGAVVNAAFARTLLGTSPDDAVGTRIRLPDIGFSGEVSAVTADAVFDVGAQTPPMLFIADPSRVLGGMVLLVRTEGDPAPLVPAIRRAIWSVDSALPLNELRTLESIVTAGLQGRRSQLLLLGVFAGLALALAGVGIYGVMDEDVARRVRELGLRQALGADRGDLARMVVLRALRLVAAGTAAGLTGAVAVNRLLSSFLYGVDAAEPRLLVGVAGVLATVALVASTIPIWRATRVDPMTALRTD